MCSFLLRVTFVNWLETKKVFSLKGIICQMQCLISTAIFSVAVAAVHIYRSFQNVMYSHCISMHI